MGKVKLVYVREHARAHCLLVKQPNLPRLVLRHVQQVSGEQTCEAGKLKPTLSLLVSSRKQIACKT